MTTIYATDYRMKCMDCGAEFEHAQTVHDCYDPCEENTGYTYGVCPQCGSDYIEDGESCPQCGEWSEAGLCRNCERRLRLKISMFAASLTPDELKAVDYMLDGKWFSELAEACKGDAV